MQLGSRSIAIRFNPAAEEMDDMLKGLSKKDLSKSLAASIMEKMHPSTGSGIREDQVKKFLRDALNIQEDIEDPTQRKEMYRDLITRYTTWGPPRIPILMDKAQFNPNNFKGNPKDQRSLRGWFSDPWAYGILSLGGLGAASAYWGPAVVFGTVAKAAPWLASVYHAIRGDYGQAAMDAAGAVVGMAAAPAAAPAAGAPVPVSAATWH